MATPNPASIPIPELIPQRPPVQMIDSLVAVSETGASGALKVTDACMFCENGQLTESGLIEFIAQTAAAFTGFKSRFMDKPVAEGYIGSVKNLVIYSLPPLGSHLHSSVHVEHEIMGYTLIAGKVYSGNELLAECEMRILNQEIR